MNIEIVFPVLMTLLSTVLGAARLIILHSITPSSIFWYMSDPSFASFSLWATSGSSDRAWLIQSAKAISSSSRIVWTPNSP